LRFLRDLTFADFARTKEQKRIAIDFFTAKTQSTQSFYHYKLHNQAFTAYLLLTAYFLLFS